MNGYEIVKFVVTSQGTSERVVGKKVSFGAASSLCGTMNAKHDEPGSDDAIVSYAVRPAKFR